MAFEYRVRSHEQWEERTNQRAADFQNYLKNEFRKFVPQKGENHIRILPPSALWKHAPHYGLDCYAHFDAGPDRSSVICLDQGAPQIGRRGEPCPICQVRNDLLRAGDDEGARRLRPVKRVVTFVINRRDEDQGPLLWGMPYTVDRDISQISKDRKTNTWFDIDDPKRGRDIYFKKEGEAILTKYFAYQLDDPSPVAQKFIDWVENRSLPDCLRWRTYAEIKKIYDGHLPEEERLSPTEEEERESYDRDDDDEPPRSQRDRRGFVEDEEEREPIRTMEKRHDEDKGRGHRVGNDDEDMQEERRERRARPRSSNGAEEQTRAAPSSDGRERAAQMRDRDDGRAAQVRDRFKKRRE